MSLMRSMFGGGGSSLPGIFGNISNLIQSFRKFASNPFGALMGLGVNLPQNLNNNPEAMVNYLRNSGQMSNQQFDELKQLADQFQGILPKQ